MEKNTPKHKIAEQKIRESISKLAIDERIPGERVIAKNLGISYMTIRKAVENLVEDGVLYKLPKKGTFVADPKKTRRKTKNIGYFLDSSIKDGLSSPYYSMIFDALEKSAQQHGYGLMYFSNISDAELHDKLNKIDGAIVSCFPRIENIVDEIREKVPVVCIDNSSADKTIPSVVIDNFNAVAESVNYLCSLGHDRIGFITGLDDSDVGRNRFAGYLNALQRNGINRRDELIFRGDYTFQTGIDGADHLLSTGSAPTAIVCANDTMAIGVIKELTKEGISVPDEISVIGFDDIRVASHMTPALTTLSAPIQEIARHAADMLEAMMSGVSMDNRHVILPGQLTIRDTCAPVRNHYDGTTQTRNAMHN
jgi:DNA-binding LacI/PurR family transcriptional regulator